MASVKLSGISKSYGTVTVLRDISLDIADGEFLVLLGPSGCGKSTLLRIIAGLESLSTGRLEMDGRDMTDAEPKDRALGMVFQNFALYPHMTVRENLSFGLKLRSTPKQEINQRVEAVCEILRIGDFLERMPAQLSGGQQQRVAMGRAIVRDSQLFLFDEPLSSLDARLRLQLRVEIKRLHQRLGNTAIYVTHDQTEAMTMADRIVIMHDGRIEQVDTPLNIYDRPASVFIGQFIGSPQMNLLSGEVRTNGGGTAIVTRSGAEWPLPNQVAEKLAGRPMLLGIRPEHLSLTSGAGIRATVTVVEPMGRETLVYCDVGPDQICIAPGDRHDVRPGDSVTLKANMDHASYFDPKTQKRIST